MDEVALRRPVGGVEVMRAQLRHLATASELERVALRVLPLGEGAHAGMDGSLTVLSFPEPEDRDVLFVSHPAGSVHVDKEAEVGEARLVFEHLLSEALPVDASGELVERVAHEL